MTNFDKAFCLLQNRLPSNYIIPIKTFKTSVKMFKCVSKQCNETYQKTISYYNNYMKKYEKDYINTYIMGWEKNSLRVSTAFDIIALSGYPIYFALDKIKGYTITENIFAILHEICHVIYDTTDEHKCDLFAIRWTKKLQKEGLI